MQSLGSHLRELRERRGVSLDEMSRITRVAVRYLEALEADDHRTLPAPVFVRGFVRAYCQALRESPGEALALFPGAESPAPGPAPVGRVSSVAAEREAASRGTVLVSFILLVVFGLGLFGLTVVLQSGRDEGGDRRAAVTARAAPESPPAPSGGSSTDAASPAPPVAEPNPATAEPAGAPPPAPRAGDDAGRANSPAAAPPARRAAEAPPTAATAPAPAPGPNAEIARVVGAISSPYRLVARASEPTWVRVRMGDGRAIEETLGANAVREWVSNEPFVLTIGNAGGVSLELNGRPLPSLGARGTVVRGIVIPPAGEAGSAAVNLAPRP
jgi:cytoskeleton protein RodZ